MDLSIYKRIQLAAFGRAFRVGIAFAVLLPLFGCTQTENDGIHDTLLNRGLVGEPESLSPRHFRSNQAASILRDIGEGLVRYNASGDLVGGVASSWGISEDGLLYTFNLRPNARWSNGDRVVAADFVAAFRELVTPEIGSANADNARHILNADRIIQGKVDPSDLGVVADTATSLEIRLRTPTPFFIQLLAHPSMLPMHATSSDDEKAPDGKNQKVSNGAYTLERWNVGATISLQRNPFYWDNENTYFSNVVYHLVQETTELIRFRAGDIDVTENVPSTSFTMVRSEYEDELRVAPSLGVYFYGFNLKSKTFANSPSIRKALSLAIDRFLLVSKITGRGEEAAFGWVPPGFKSYRSRSVDEIQMTQLERQELAIRLYNESGYNVENPLQFELRYNTSDVQRRIAVAIQQMWQDVLGAEVTLVNEEFRVLIANINSKIETEVFRLSWTGDYNDPQAFLKIFESSNPSNFTGFSNSKYDALMEQASIEPNELRRIKLLEDAEELMLSEHPTIPLYFHVSKHLVSREIVGWEENILDIHSSQYLSKRTPAQRQ